MQLAAAADASGQNFRRVSINLLLNSSYQEFVDVAVIKGEVKSTAVLKDQIEGMDDDVPLRQSYRTTYKQGVQVLATLPLILPQCHQSQR